jgi:hypothetical protein
MGKMERRRTLIPLFTLALVAAVCASAQTVTENVPVVPREKVIQPLIPPVPFSIDTATPWQTPLVEYRSVDQMSEHDRLLAANAESSIAEHAGHTGLEFNQGQWSYKQVVCPALPNHLFLRFLRNNGTGDVSVFTASIPRGEEGRVRIIPIQLRSYSLFSPAPINAITISTFNHIRAEDNPEHAPVANWLGTAFCYAALAGGHPQLAEVNKEPPTDKLPLAQVALLSIPSKGGAVLSFDDASTSPKFRTWTMVFDGKGKLLKASHAPAALVPINWVHPAPIDAKTRQLLAYPATETVPASQAPAVVTDHPTSPTAKVTLPAATASAQ